MARRESDNVKLFSGERKCVCVGMCVGGCRCKMKKW